MWNKQRYCWQLPNHVWIHNFPQEQLKLPCSENLSISSWSYDMEGHAKKCVKRYCDVASRTTQQLHKVSISCNEHNHFKEEQWKSVGECSKVCSQIVLTCSYLARIGRPVILWSVKKLARYNHKMDPSLWQTIISFDLTFTRHVTTNKIVMWETLPNNVDWDCFKTPILQEILRIQNLHQEEHCAFWEVIRFFQ